MRCFWVGLQAPATKLINGLPSGGPFLCKYSVNP